MMLLHVFSLPVFVIIYQKHKNILKFYYAFSLKKFDVKMWTGSVLSWVVELAALWRTH